MTYGHLWKNSGLMSKWTKAIIGTLARSSFLGIAMAHNSRHDSADILRLVVVTGERRATSPMAPFFPTPLKQRLRHQQKKTKIVSYSKWHRELKSKKLKQQKQTLRHQTPTKSTSKASTIDSEFHYSSTTSCRLVRSKVRPPLD